MGWGGGAHGKQTVRGRGNLRAGRSISVISVKTEKAIQAIFFKQKV